MTPDANALDVKRLKEIAQAAPLWKDFNVSARHQGQREAAFAAVEAMRSDVPAVLSRLERAESEVVRLRASLEHAKLLLSRVPGANPMIGLCHDVSDLYPPDEEKGTP